MLSLSAIGIAGMDRLVQRNVLAMSGRAVEAAGDVTTLLLDKTGTITYGNRRASEFVRMVGVREQDLVRAAALSSLADPTPEGVSIVELASQEGVDVGAPAGGADGDARGVIVPFTAQTRMSGLDLPDGSRIRKGAGSAVTAWLADEGSSVEAAQLGELEEATRRISQSGGTPLVVAMMDTPVAGAVSGRVLGVVHLKTS
ncbi:high-affinity K+ transport system ATPase subunit B [Pseudoclavibacter helvolus]|uniref:High-affinity K+ transport system ATPase subunit B n=1 Tax=Pseudoclavibacter helvolus TaxID=255205 RepID=A0A7W4UPJ2_9MICO|nr:high-affinity K+ transport system ATPase subunit B [Pseudoclavibacter helvolus]